MISKKDVQRALNKGQLHRSKTTWETILAQRIHLFLKEQGIKYPTDEFLDAYFEMVMDDDLIYNPKAPYFDYRAELEKHDDPKQITRMQGVFFLFVEYGIKNPTDRVVKALVDMAKVED